MDLSQAIEFAQLVNAAYAIASTDLKNSANAVITIGAKSYTVVTTIYANDLATDINPDRCLDLVSIGLILQATGASDVVIAVRGTQGIMEWIHDVDFFQVLCPFHGGAGRTEDGFTAMYRSLRTGTDPGSPSVVNAMAALAFPNPVSSLTICGHSLGGAIGTLLALDLAANSTFKNPTVYTYASPRTGDPSFVRAYDQAIPNTFRIANRVDLVPKLPFPPFYEHVLGLYDLNPVRFLPFPPRILIRPEIACEHALDSYRHLLSLAAGGPVLPLDPACVP